MSKAQAPSAWESPTRSVTLNGAPLTLARMNVGQYLRLAPVIKDRSLAPLLAAFAGGGEGDQAGGMPQLVDVLATDGEWLLQAIAIAAGETPEAIKAAGPDELLEIGGAVVELNFDFFTRRMVPVLGQVAQHLAERMSGSGLTPSSS